MKRREAGEGVGEGGREMVGTNNVRWPQLVEVARNGV